MHKNKQFSEMTSPENTPVISGVIPCRNEASSIEQTLRSLLDQIPPEGGFELIVADGMSDDGTQAIVQRMQQEDPRVRLVENPGKITPAGMNTGIKASQGKYIAILGAHNRYNQSYLLEATNFLDSHPEIDNVGGSMFLETVNPVQKAIGAVFHHPFSVGGARWHNPEYEGEADTVFGGVYRREVFSQIGLFDEEMVRNQDDELNLRLTRSGRKIWHTPRMKSWYQPRSSFRQLFSQYRQYGFWKVRVIQKHRIPASIRHLIPGLFVLSIFLLPALALLATLGNSQLMTFASKALSGIWLLELGIYFLSMGFASMSLSRFLGQGYFGRCFLAFCCFHFGYGLGFLEGIRDFVVFKRFFSGNQTDLTR